MTRDMYIQSLTQTRLEGMKRVLTEGILSGEMHGDMTVSELLIKIEELQIEKSSVYNAKLRDIKRRRS